MTVCVEVWLRFDGHHGEGLEFVEAETPDGESIDLGEWAIGAGGSTLKIEVPERCVSTKNTVQPPIFQIEECPACESEEVEKYDHRVSCDRCGWTEYRGNS